MIYGTLWYDAVRYVGVCLSPKIGTRKVPTVRKQIMKKKIEDVHVDTSIHMIL